MDAIAHSPDAAPGEDGIPYALYRLVPEVSATIMSHVLEDLAGAGDPSDLVTWEQLLVWIPKHPAATTPEEMRPLGLPTTFVRTMCVVLYRKLNEVPPSLRLSP